MNIKEKIQKMSAKEIILAMVEGLRNPTVNIDMSTYGRVNNSVCYGCAATNMICRLGSITVDDFIKANVRGSSTYLFEDSKISDFIDIFEEAINELRNGYLLSYNRIAIVNNFAKIEGPEFLDFEIDDDFTKEDLQKFVELAEQQ